MLFIPYQALIWKIKYFLYNFPVKENDNLRQLQLFQILKLYFKKFNLQENYLINRSFVILI